MHVHICDNDVHHCSAIVTASARVLLRSGGLGDAGHGIGPFNVRYKTGRPFGGVSISVWRIPLWLASGSGCSNQHLPSDRDSVFQFIHSREVRQCLPPNWDPPADFCHCGPKIAITTAVKPFGDRVVLVGDCGATRLYKDGIGSAYRTAKAAARTIVFHGLSEGSFRRHYWPVCKKISRDNTLGHFVFTVTRQMQKYGFARRALWRMVSEEQRVSGPSPRMSMVLWDTFTGSAPYSSVLRRILNPVFIARFLWELTGRNLAIKTPEEGLMESTVLGRWFKDGEIICRQGELGDCLYVVEKGKVELMHRDGNKEFCVRVVEEGNAWDEEGLLERDHRRGATARAVGEVCVLTIERRLFLDRLQEDPSFVLKIMRKMSRRIQELEGALVCSANQLSCVAPSGTGHPRPTIR